MKAKIFSSRTLALILVLAMAVSLFTISASAATSWSLEGHGTNIASVTIDGADFYQPDYTTSTDTHGTIYDYYIELNEETAEGTTVTAHFTKSASAAADCTVSRVGPAPNPPQGYQIVYGYRADDYAATVTEGAATARAYVHEDIRNSWGDFDTYVFHYYLPYPVSISTGDPVFIAWNGTNGTVTGRNGSSRIPGSFTLWVEGSNTITVDGSTVSSSYENSGNYAFTISPKTSGDTTIVAASNGTTYTVICGPKSATPSGVAPSSVVSYLPIGQFAQGSGWGSSVGKFTNGYASTGVSLGAFGGYIEFDFQQRDDDGNITSAGITNDENNPYGVDFVIYGNAFTNNPEAGAVQVSEDGVTWYELAGSRYYDGNFNFTGTTVANKFSKAYTGALNNATVQYNGSSSAITATVTAGGTTMTADPLINSYGWWPTTAKGYPMAGSHNNAGSNVQVSRSDSALTFSGLTLIPDSDDTAYYAFGYADVTPNGSPATYGDAINPYTPYSSTKVGGDGFDLEWAVDSNGLPVDVTGKTFRYVRVYSAVLDNGTFGETSTEVCGIFTTANKAASETSVTPAPVTVTVGGTVVTLSKTASGIQTVTIPKNTSTDVTVSANGNGHVYINNVYGAGTASNSFVLARNATQIVRVIVQDDTTAQPYIGFVMLKGGK